MDDQTELLNIENTFDEARCFSLDDFGFETSGDGITRTATDAAIIVEYLSWKSLLMISP